MSGVEVDIAVVGAGLAGLHCARALSGAGFEIGIWEASDAVGGRIRTDSVDGFLLDRGFQLLNPAYPAVQRWVDVTALDLGAFGAGVAARTDNGIVRLGHPVREPGLIPSTLRALAARPGEVAALARWARPLFTAVGARDHLAEHVRRGRDLPLRESLDRAGVRGLLRRVVERFFAGVLLDDAGETSTEFALLLTWMFVTGVPGLPANGMAALPRQLAAGLEDQIRLSAPVHTIEPSGASYTVRTDAGPVSARRVVVATDAIASASLLGGATPRTRGVVTQWFAASEPPTDLPLLFVDACRQRRGPLVNAAVVSAAQPSYAPPGQHLVEASALLRPGQPTPTEDEMRRHAGELFRGPTSGWVALHRHDVVHALPTQEPPLQLHRPLVTDLGVVVCGDHRETASIQGALVSGQRAARAVAEMLR